MIKTWILAFGLLAGALPDSSQVILDPIRAYLPGDLRQYLSLTVTQVAFILQATSDYNQIASDKQQRISQLQNEIADETRKDQPDPMALGIRYAEIESIHRDVASQLTALRDKLLASLNDTQRGKLKSLADARDLQPLINGALCESLLIPWPGNIVPANRVSSVTISSTVSGCFLSDFLSYFPSDLMQFLAVSAGQVDTITGLNRDYYQQTASRQQNIAQLQQQIAQETAKDTLDPIALGALYAQVETIRRDIRKDAASLVSNAQAVLNDAQRVKLSSLDDARKLQPLINSAVCANLLNPQTNQWFDTGTFVGGLTATSSCGGARASFLLPFPNP